MNKNRRSEKTAPQLLSIALAVVLFTGLWLAAVYLSASLQSRSVTAETRSGVYDGNGNELKTNEVYELPDQMIFTESAVTESTLVLNREMFGLGSLNQGYDRLAQNQTINVVFDPVSATNKNVDWALSFDTTEPDFANWYNHLPEAQRSPEDYIDLIPAENNSSAEIRCKNQFGAPILITATSQANPDLTARCRLDCYKSIQRCDIVLRDSDGNSLSAYNISTYNAKETTVSIENVIFGIGTVNPLSIVDNKQYEYRIAIGFAEEFKTYLKDTYSFTADCFKEPEIWGNATTTEYRKDNAPIVLDGALYSVRNLLDVKFTNPEYPLNMAKIQKYLENYKGTNLFRVEIAFGFTYTNPQTAQNVSTVQYGVYNIPLGNLDFGRAPDNITIDPPNIIF